MTITIMGKNLIRKRIIINKEKKILLYGTNETIILNENFIKAKGRSI